MLKTVFIGGGTPTCLWSGAIVEIIETIKQNFILQPGAELTIEANPGTVDRDKLARLRQAGINRLSLGAQSCAQKTLDVLGRIHTHAQTVAAVQQAREVGFQNINLDLIYGVPGQTLASWRNCLEEILGLNPDHVSVYGLQIEEGTPLAAMLNSGRLVACDEEWQLQMYRDTVTVLSASGLQRYEISNFARPGRVCRHNLVYWRNRPYMGAGPAAHSHWAGRRSANASDLNGYLEKLSRGDLPVDWWETITPENEIFETIFLGLRLAEGLNLPGFHRRFGRSPGDIYPGVVEKLVGKGLLKKTGESIILTGRGVELANLVLAEFVPLTNS